MKIAIFPVLLLIISLNVYAGRCSSYVESLVSNGFESVFFDNDIYQCNECHSNVYRFVKHLENQNRNLDLKNMNVLFLVSKNTEGLIPPYDARYVFYVPNQRDPERLGMMNLWLHHVVLELGGRVYDFDYSQNALVANVQDYFRDFIGDQVDIYQIPADVYINSVYPKIISLNFDKINVSRYRISYQDFLSR